MRKQTKQFFQKGLCGILSAAMILTGSIIPDLSVLAAQPDVEDTADANGQVNETPSVEDSGAVQNPEADGSNANGNESDAGDVNSDKGNDVTSPDDEENSDIKDEAKENDVQDGDTKDDDVKVAPDEETDVTATSDKSYTDQSVTLNYYVGDLSDGETVGFYKWAASGSDIIVDESINKKLGWKAWGNQDVYQMNSVSGRDGWYNITFKVTGTLTVDSDTGEGTESTTSFQVFRSTVTGTSLFECGGSINLKIYAGLLSGEMTAVKGGEGYKDIAAVDGEGEGDTTGEFEYKNQEVTLNYFVGDLAEDETVGFYKWVDTNGDIEVDLSANPLLPWGTWGKPEENPVYKMNPVEGHAGWYHIAFKVTDTIKITDTPEKNSGLVSFSVYKSSADSAELFKFDVWNNTEIYIGLLSGEITAIKDGKGYASIEDAAISIEALEALVKEAKELKEEDYKATGWKKFSEALTAAEAVLEEDEPTSDEIEEAYENLEKAMDALVKSSVAEAEINVKPVALTDDFITGADVSSYLSLKDSGTVFKDEEGNELDDAGFFQYLHDGGTNWIRIRVWNDPYDSNKNGYGGGNNDLAKAKEMGKLATDAGMKVLIDFHYSDFWADPGKQQAPKAWAGMSVDEKAEAVYQFTKKSLEDLESAGVNVGMVQVGNETTGGICGVFYDSDGWEAAAKIYNAGSKAVREVDSNCLVAVHFTNPETSGKYAALAKNLDTYKVDYDVFASSYYPFWHGTTENLTSVLANVAKTYNKKVMVAETSWATTLDDQDGHDNTVRVGSNDTGQPYAFSVQGQADEIRAVVEAANNVNKVEGVAAGSSIGVFYWEAAWLSPYYAYNEDGTKNEELYNKNKAAWEQYGSGWAASYGGEYDPKDAGKWYGGSAVDNQAWFDFDGKALPTAKIYSYIRTGAEAERAVSNVVNPSITINAGETVEYPEKVTVNFNDGTSTDYTVVWNAEDKAEIDTEVPGKYNVSGTVTCEYQLRDGSTVTEIKDVTLTITVKADTVPELINPGFEDDVKGNWELNGATRKEENQHSGKGVAHFYSATATNATVKQTVKGLDAGIYTFGGYIEGADADADAVVTIYDKDDNQKGEVMKSSCSLDGWMNWKNPEIEGIVISEGDYLVVGMEIAVKDGGWGTIDDFYLYATQYGIVLDDQNKNGTLSASAVNSAFGKTITIKAAPKTDYILTKLTISGKGVKNDTLTSSNGTVAYDEKTQTAVLTYDDKVTGETTESFIMPKSMAKVSAVFRTDVDVAALDKLIAEYDQVIFDGYTDESWNAFEDALEAAKAASENVDAKQEEIDSAKEALETAYKGLTKAPTAKPEQIAELSTLIEKYDKLTSDGYTEESWKNFADALAAAKAAVEKENATTTDISRAKAALEKAHKELTKTSTGTVDLTDLEALIEECKSLEDVGYTAESWKNFTDALEAAEKTAAKTDVTQEEVDSAKADLETAYIGLVREGLWMEEIPDQTYTGTAIKPDVKVYHGNDLLELKKDYTVAYTSNTNVGKATVTVIGKGNFKGKATKNFEIKQKKISDGDIIVADVYAIINKNGKVTNPKVTVKYGKKTLKNNSDYRVEYPSFELDEDGKIVAKDYVITIYTTDVKKDNKGNLVNSVNYTGERKIKYTVCGNDTKLMSKAKVTLEKTKVDYKNNEQGEYGKGTEQPAVTVKMGNDTLTKDVDYVVSYENWDKVGKATVTVTANKGSVYYGSKSVTYTVNGTKLAAKDLTIKGINASYDYTGKPIYVSANGSDNGNLTVTRIKGVVEPVELKEGTDYEVSYKTGKKLGEHTNVGTVTVTITGINAYTGSVNKTFKITAVDLDAFGKENAPAGLAFEAPEAAKYTKTGAKPGITKLTFNGETLVEKQDYTLTYQKNNKVEAVTGNKSATMIIKGKGNFKGQIKHSYAVTIASADDVYATAVDIVQPANVNQLKSTVKVFEKETGKALKAGTDYDKNITYYSDAACTNQITAETFETDVDIDKAIYAKVIMKDAGSYAGATETATPGYVTAKFRVYDSAKKMANKKIVVTVDTTVDKDGKDIWCDNSKAKNPYYRGTAIEPQVTVTLKGTGGAEDTVLKVKEDYTVDYTNNINKGKATITVTGVGNGYGGSKSVKFTIVSTDMKWYEKATETIASFFSNLF